MSANVNLKRCANGHFYDANKFSSCPHCGQGNQLDATLPLNDAQMQANVPPTCEFGAGYNPTPSGDIPDTTPLGGMPGQTIPTTTPLKAVPSGVNEDSGETIEFEAQTSAGRRYNPVVGWLVCTRGEHLGESFALHNGKNFIGRDADMDVCLRGEQTVSRSKHANITYDRRNNLFLAKDGDSNELFYLNSEPVLSVVKLKKNDLLQVGKVELMLIPCCDDVFVWPGMTDEPSADA